MGKRSRTDRANHDEQSGGVIETGHKRRSRMFQAIAVVIVLFTASILIFRSTQIRSSINTAGHQEITFTRVGRNGPVFTVSVPRPNAADDERLMRIAEQLSTEEIQAGGSGQISVMIWPDDVPVPKEPPTTEFDASMKTQIAGIFINPKLNVKHMIRFRDGATVSERDFGRPTR
jgi:hypothetical protein